MVTCCQRDGIESQFDRKTAERELRRFRRRGPIRSTQCLIDDLRTAGIARASLLDIGGGVGAIHHALLDAGANNAVHGDVSAEYINVARDEAGGRGHADRVRFVHGDFVQVASGLPDADVVTLDRVICCYPDMGALVGRAADKARRLVGAVYAYLAMPSVRAYLIAEHDRRHVTLYSRLPGGEWSREEVVTSGRLALPCP